jgi:DNA-binding PadR family transcriptional regulator
MTTTNTSPNGARAKIIRALIAEGMLTTHELATHTGLRPDQARDNAVQARKDGLVTSERDDVTGLVAYKVTAKGREYCAGSAHSTPKSTASESPVDDAAKELDGRSQIHKERDSLIRERDKLLTDCASTMQALDLAQKAMARQRDDAVILRAERYEAVCEANHLRELAAQVEAARDRLHQDMTLLKAQAEESDAAINERLSKYDALVAENDRLSASVTSMYADKDALCQQVIALESRTPSPMVTEYVVRHENGCISSSSFDTIAEAIELATEDAKELGKPVLVYGLVLIGAVEIRPVFVGAES